MIYTEVYGTCCLQKEGEQKYKIHQSCVKLMVTAAGLSCCMCGQADSIPYSPQIVQLVFTH